MGLDLQSSSPWCGPLQLLLHTDSEDTCTDDVQIVVQSPLRACLSLPLIWQSFQVSHSVGLYLTHPVSEPPSSCWGALECDLQEPKPSGVQSVSFQLGSVVRFPNPPGPVCLWERFVSCGSCIPQLSLLTWAHLSSLTWEGGAIRGGRRSTEVDPQQLLGVRLPHPHLPVLLPLTGWNTGGGASLHYMSLLSKVT